MHTRNESPLFAPTAQRACGTSRPASQWVLQSKPLVRLMEAHNGLTGLIVENIGIDQQGVRREFDGIWGSSLTESTAKGKPDIEAVDVTARTQTLHDLLEVTSKPIVYDADTGGRPEHLQFTIRTLERLGVSAAVIEDKIGLKKNSLFGNDVPQVQDSIENFCAKIQAGKKLLIVADYDCDGATACAVGIRGLRAFGAAVNYLVPNRFEYGYGLTPEIVRLAHDRFRPEILITVDNGIASLDGDAEANRLGMQTLITDHHLPGPRLPEATCIINPNLPGCGFPSKNLAGVGVMFYLLLALRAELRMELADAPDTTEVRLVTEATLAGRIGDLEERSRIGLVGERDDGMRRIARAQSDRLPNHCRRLHGPRLAAAQPGLVERADSSRSLRRRLDQYGRRKAALRCFAMPQQQAIPTGCAGGSG